MDKIAITTGVIAEDETEEHPRLRLDRCLRCRSPVFVDIDAPASIYCCPAPTISIAAEPLVEDDGEMAPVLQATRCDWCDEPVGFGVDETLDVVYCSVECLDAAERDDDGSGRWMSAGPDDDETKWFAKWMREWQSSPDPMYRSPTITPRELKARGVGLRQQVRSLLCARKGSESDPWAL